MRKIGAITIGQSPRTDLVPEIKQLLGPDVEVIEGGALDGLTLEQVKQLEPGPGDYVLVTRMADGTAVKIAERHILPRMQEQIDRVVALGADIVLLLCTGEFPEFRCSRLLLRPQRIIWSCTAAVATGLKLGVLVPDADQIGQALQRWSGIGSQLRVEAASPYGKLQELDIAARKLADWGAQLVVMDCMGYTLAMKAMVSKSVGCPVVLARSVVARVAAELAFS